MGSALYGALLMLGYCASRCFGRMHGLAQQLEKKDSVDGEYGFLRWMTTVNLSGSSTPAIWSKRTNSEFAGSFTTLIEKTTSSASNGAPSDHFTPLRK